MSNAPSKPVSFSRPKVGYFSNRPRIYTNLTQTCVTSMPPTEFYCHSQLGCLYSLHKRRHCLPKYKYQTPKTIKIREREYYFISILSINEEAKSFPCRHCSDGQLFTSDIFILTWRTRKELPSCDFH